MTTKARRRRKPLKTKVPINFKLSKEDSDFLKNGPQVALLLLRENKGTATHWCTITTRIRVMRAIAKMDDFSDEVIEETERFVAVTETIRLRHVDEQPRLWSISPQLS